MTHLEILNQLPSPYKEQAIRIVRNFKGIKWLYNSVHKDLASVIFYGTSNQKGKDAEYWFDIWKRAQAGEFDKDPKVTLPREDWEWLENFIALNVDFSKTPVALKIFKAIQSQLNPKQ